MRLCLNTEEEERSPSSPHSARPRWPEERDLPGTSQDILQLLQQMKLWIMSREKKKEEKVEKKNCCN